MLKPLYQAPHERGANFTHSYNGGGYGDVLERDPVKTAWDVENGSLIINIGSTAATVGWQDNPAYCASKSGLLGLTRCVALEGAPHGVTCVMISPT